MPGSSGSENGIRLGLKENWPQFSLLVLINAFVGGMVGIERTVVPLIGAEEFHLASTTLIVSFIVSFGVVKACANLVSGHLADGWGRKRVLVLGWLVGLPVPFMLIAAPSWKWVIAANALLGINQGFAWSMTVIMKIDLVGPKSRGLAVGLNEFAGYLAVGVTAFLTGYIAQRHGLRPAPLYLGVAYAVLGAALSILAVRDTRHHVRTEVAGHAQAAETIGFWEIFTLTSFRDRNLFAASQAGLVNNLNDGMSWGIFPLFFAGFGLSVERIGILKAIYPATWGILQVATGPLRQPAARDRHCDGLSKPDRRSVRCIASELACAFAQRLPLLARPRLRDRRAVGRHHRRHAGNVVGDRHHWRAHLRLRCGRDDFHARRSGQPSWCGTGERI
jgi:MFS family permease